MPRIEEIRGIRARAERAKLNPVGNAYATCGEYEREIMELFDCIDRLTAEVERLEREKDAAVEDLHIMGGCPICKHNTGRNENTGLPLCSLHHQFPSGCFEWRGVQPEGKEVGK